MKLYDLIIIYLACGAPFGVYYFFDNKLRLPVTRHWLKSIFAFVFWIPFALKMLQQKSFSKKSSDNKFAEKPSLDSDEKIYFYQKQFEEILRESNLRFSIYQFRELFERYTGLTLTVNATIDNINQDQVEQEIYLISDNQNPGLSTICLNRRNRIRLSVHQINARQNFVDFLFQLFASNCDRKALSRTTGDFFSLLNDAEAKTALAKLTEDTEQTRPELTVNRLEKELWKPEKHKQLPASQSSVPLQAMTATANLRSKD